MSIWESNQQSSAGDERPFAFCQNCGRPLDEASARVAGQAVYCEPCLTARLAGAPPAIDPTLLGGPYAPAPGVPNPTTAALLGFIPGVGAMYNEQYAKGIVHLIVFAVLISLSHASDLFGLFAFGWICYMVIEAHHTARARRDGTPLPNPFGLNDVGDRLGFGRAWPGGSPMPPTGFPPTGTGGPGSASGPGPVAGAAGGVGASPATPYTPVPPATAWGAPAESYNPAAYGSPYATPYGQGYPQGLPQGYNPGFPQGYSAPYGSGGVPPAPPYGTAYAPVSSTGVPEPPYTPRPSRFPAGAVWLIGLGTLFLLSTTGVFETLFGWSLVGFVLIGLAVWIFIRRMLDTGPTLANDGSAGYMPRIMRALRGPVWILLVGILLLLNEFNLLPWRRSWPLFIILAGVMTLLQRAASQAAAGAAFSAAGGYPAADPRWSSGAAAASSPADSSLAPWAATPPQDVQDRNSAGDAGMHEGGN